MMMMMMMMIIMLTIILFVLCKFRKIVQMSMNTQSNTEMNYIKVFRYSFLGTIPHF